MQKKSQYINVLLSTFKTGKSPRNYRFFIFSSISYKIGDNSMKIKQAGNQPRELFTATKGGSQIANDCIKLRNFLPPPPLLPVGDDRTMHFIKRRVGWG